MSRPFENGFQQTQKNYIVNGGMMISQENGTTAGTTSNYYPVDQFRSELNLTTGALSYAQVASLTPGGSPNRLRITVTTANASPAASEYADVFTKIEGYRIADLRFGTSSAKQFVLQFGVKAPAGTYSIAYSNGAGDRTYVAEYTIASGEANTDVVKSVAITGDLTGTWDVGNGAGLQVRFGLMSGTTNKTSPGSWGAGLFVASTNQFNFMGTNGNVFELFDVGLYEGTVAPKFQLPDYLSELTLCKRYFAKHTTSTFTAVGTVRTGGASSYFGLLPLDAPMRSTPTIVASGAAVYVGDTANTVTSITGTLAGNGLGAAIYLVCIHSGSSAAGSAICLLPGASGMTFNSRM